MKPGTDAATGGIEDKRKQRKDEETTSGQEMLWRTAAVMMLCFFCPFFKRERSRGTRRSPGPSG